MRRQAHPFVRPLASGFLRGSTGPGVSASSYRSTRPHRSSRLLEEASEALWGCRDEPEEGCEA